MTTITILGSGTSTGIPIVGCNCEVCQSTNPCDKRMRSSLLLEFSSGKSLLIDASPDLRTQLLRANVKRLDAALITHAHADHCHGLDDLRPFCFWQKTSIPVHCSTQTAGELTEKFAYIFRRDQLFTKDRPVIGGGIPKLDLFLLPEEGSCSILGEQFEIFQLSHGYTTTTCFRHGAFAYLIDCNHIPDDIIYYLRSCQLELLLIDCIRPEAHDTHLGGAAAFDYLRRINARQTGLIHMGHEWSHDALIAACQEAGLTTAAPVYDGMKLEYST